MATRECVLLGAFLAPILLGAPSCLAQQADDMPGMAPGHAMPGASPADTAMMAGMDQMNRAMHAAPMTGDADRDFIAMMIPHHEGAVAMAKVELTYGKDPALRRLAQGIVDAQEREIATMRQWQAAQGVK